MQETRVTSGVLGTSYTAVFGSSLFPILNLASNVRQSCLISEIKISVKLTSISEYVHVSDATLDPNEQAHLRRVAFREAEGKSVSVKIGDLEDPITYGIKNVSGGYFLDLVKVLTIPPRQSILLDPTEILYLKVDESLGANDKVQYRCSGVIFTDSYYEY